MGLIRTTVQNIKSIGTTLQVSNATQDGYLSHIDWNTFNNKLSEFGYTPVANTVTINGHPLSNNISLTLTDIGISNVENTKLSTWVGTSNINTVGTVTTGIWSGSFGAISGANLTSLTANNLSGTIPSGVLNNSTVYIGTSGISLNRGSGSLTLNGVSIDGNAATVTTNANLTGDVTSLGNVTTLPIVNASVGSFGSGTMIPVITVNAKGQVIGITSVANSGGGGSGVTSLSALSDVAESSLTNGDLFVYNSSSNRWINKTLSAAGIQPTIGTSSITNSMLVNSAVANLSGTNTGDSSAINQVLTGYSSITGSISSSDSILTAIEKLNGNITAITGATPGIPSISLGTNIVNGNSPNFLRSDATILAFDFTLPTIAGIAATGTANTAARRDHVHPAQTTIPNAVYTTDSATITNTMLAGGITNVKLANSTISGRSLGSNLAVLGFGSHMTGTSYNGSSDVMIATDAGSVNIGSTIVARDIYGNFSAGTITANITGTASNVNNATFTTALTVNTGNVILKGNSSSSTLILGAGNLTLSGNNTGDQTLSSLGAQASLGFTPVQQGGGTGQNTNKLYVGWSSNNSLYLQVDSTNFNDVWPINVAGTATGTTTLLSASSGAGLIGSIFSATGAINMTVQAAIDSCWISIKRFGGTGNGSTDDTTAMQAAHNTGHPIFYPDGTYKFSSITIPSGGIIGAGIGKTTLKCSSGTVDAILCTAHGYVNDGEAYLFRDFNLANSVGGSSGSGIRINPSIDENRGSIFNNVYISQFYTGIQFDKASSWSITDCGIAEFKKFGVWVKNTNNADSGDSGIVNTGITTSVSGTVSVYINSSGGLKITNSKLNGGGTGIYLNPQTGNTSDLLVSNTSIEGMTSYAVYLGGSGGYTWTNIVLNGNQIACTNGIGITIDNSVGQMVISNNVIQVTGSSGSCGVIVSSGSGFSISDNVFYNTGSTSNEAVVIGPSVTNSSVRGNLYLKNFNTWNVTLANGSSTTTNENYGPTCIVSNSSVQSLTSGSSTILILNSVANDTNSNFNNSTYRFTPSVTGYYLLTAEASFDGSGSLSRAMLQLRKNSSEVVRSDTSPNNIYSTGTVNSIQYANGIDDYFDVAVTAWGSSVQVNSSRFEGAFLRGA